MPERGWVKLWRKSEDSRFWSNGAITIGLWTYLLLKANWKSSWFLDEEIKRGSLAISKSSLGRSLKLSPKTLRYHLEKLETARMIHCQNRANQYSIITICNYDTYQSDQNSEGQTRGKPRANALPRDLPTSKEEEEGKKGKPPPSTAPARGNGNLSVDHLMHMLDADKYQAIQTDEVIDALQAYVEHRQAMPKKNRLTERAMTIQLNHLLKWGPIKAVESCETSVANGYQGLFEPKTAGKLTMVPTVDLKTQLADRKARDG